MPGGQPEDRWRLTAAAPLLCHAIFLWRRLVCLSQFETSGQVSAFIEYMELKIAPPRFTNESAGGCEWPGRPEGTARRFNHHYTGWRSKLLLEKISFNLLLWKCQDVFYQEVVFF